MGLGGVFKDTALRPWVSAQADESKRTKRNHTAKLCDPHRKPIKSNQNEQRQTLSHHHHLPHVFRVNAIIMLQRFKSWELQVLQPQGLKQ